MTVFQAPRQFLQLSVSRHRPPFLRAQKLSFCFYFVNDLPFGRLNVKPDYLLMTALFIYPLPRSAADMDKLRAETRIKAEHLADGIQPCMRNVSLCVYQNRGIRLLENIGFL